MSDLREAMARALYEHREGPVANADFSRQQALWRDCLLQADAALAAIEAAGFVVVPRAADDETLDTIAAQFSEYADSLPSRTIARRAWAGALITAPKP